MKKKENFCISLFVVLLIVPFNCKYMSKGSYGMDNDFEEKSKREISEIIKKINLSWVEGRPENLAEYIHENMMIVSPELKIMGKGKETCIKSYADFVNQATVNKYDESEAEIYVWGSTAIASYEYDVEWEMNGKSYKEQGRDLFVFTYENGKWLAVWRKVIPNKGNQ